MSVRPSVGRSVHEHIRARGSQEDSYSITSSRISGRIVGLMGLVSILFRRFLVFFPAYMGPARRPCRHDKTKGFGILLFDLHTVICSFFFYWINPAGERANVLQTDEWKHPLTELLRHHY